MFLGCECALAKRDKPGKWHKGHPTEFILEQRAEDRKLLPLMEEPTML